MGNEPVSSVRRLCPQDGIDRNIYQEAFETWNLHEISVLKKHQKTVKGRGQSTCEFLRNDVKTME